MFRFYRYILSKSAYEIIFLFFILHEIYGYAVYALIEYLGYAQSLESYKFKSFGDALFICVLIAPILETLIAQKIPYLLLRKFTGKLYVIYFLSSILFALGHTYSFIYVLVTFFSGLLYIVLYSVLLKKDTKKAFWGVFSIHAFNNLIAVFHEWF